MVHKLPQLKGLKVGWLRLHFRVNDSLTGRSLVLQAYQTCASEVYLDGKLIRRFGKVSAEPDRQMVGGANALPDEFILTPGDHVMAVRFAVWPGAFALKWGNTLMAITVTSLHGFAITLKQNVLGGYLYMFVASVCFLLCLLHLSFYRYDPTKRANLYFSAYTLASTFGFAIWGLFWQLESAPEELLMMTLSSQAIILSTVFLVEALISLYAFRLRRARQVFWTLFAVSAVLVVFNANALCLGIPVLFFEGVLTWLTIKAMREKRRGAGIIAVAFAASILFLVAGIAIVVFDINTSNLLWTAVWAGIFLCPAIGISLYLSREFALDSKSLREKLLEVEKLSARTLVQEQEKQQLLASQNERLELLVSKRTDELSKSLDNLRATQNQLIQSEKMASLGELTAGIAHEIQNPLNFVNNFAEVSVELLGELKEEAGAGNTADVIAIADDLQQNLGKISHHGRRADNIVKGMLQHSRTSSGAKEQTDLNALADEYLRLSYHGLRAKDKSFNAQLVTGFDPELPVVNVIAQDIGRVLLNLFNNAFQAVGERLAKEHDGYQPKVEVHTKRTENGIEILVRDNGPGIPEGIRDKIFQPFFTTKPAGEGTGLGLSLSYDIVTKMHGGALTVVSEEGKFTEFAVMLPG
ncbi:histidine kinase [Pedobacter sp. HMF7056]|uniref:histidine kinase n=2 Tax=Hufsiella ginkgonis TaxID=2695274 RepID=A0A7K1Y1U2_9SPHI|nr:histidine kinase [Hufsiella ginkgonis]